MAANPDALREFRDAYAVAYREVLRLVDRGDPSLVAILEGKDAPYYLPRVESWMHNKAVEMPLKLVGAKGRANVLKVRDAVDRNQSVDRRYLFFIIDRDFTDGSSGRSDTYVTSGYSVESFFVSWTFVWKTLTYETLQGESNEELDSAISELENLFTELSLDFLTQISGFHAWVHAQRRNHEKRVRLDRYDKKSFCKISQSEGRVGVEIVDFSPEDLENDGNHPSGEEIANSLATTDNITLETVRGKQSVAFVLNFLDFATAWLRERLGHLEIEIRNLDVGIKSILPRLTQYADTSDCLRDFLDSWWDIHWSAPQN